MEAQKYIKIIFRRGDPIYLSLPKWEEIIKSEQTLVPYKLDDEQEWSGRTLNKADVLRSEYDREYSEAQSKKSISYYRRKSDGVIVEAIEGSLPIETDLYEKI